MRLFLLFALIWPLAVASAAAAAEAPPFDPAEAQPGGAATARIDEPDAAFARPVGNLPPAMRALFDRGADLFYRRWIEGPAPAPALTGLGPLYNALSCQQCHLNDGRGAPPEPDSLKARSMVLKLLPPHPVYGGQLQDRAVAGHTPEGQVAVDWREHVVRLADGTEVRLRRPRWRVAAPAYAAPGADYALSARIAPPLPGMGLLQAVDPADAPRRRFGWASGAATVHEQTIAALANDMGVAGATADGPEAPRDVVDALVFYSANLGPPPRPGAARPDVLAGRRVFHEAGCAGCHRPSAVTGASPWPWLAGQRIWPYSDLALHDLGPDLADGPQRYWRTQPLWGLGRNAAVNGNAAFLHDGRARSALEAVLWHGGEAADARDRVKALAPADRAALLAFLDSL